MKHSLLREPSMFLAHFGFSLLALGVLAAGSFPKKYEGSMALGDEKKFAGFTIRLDKIKKVFIKTMSTAVVYSM